MKTVILKASGRGMKKALEQAAGLIRAGELVAFPTETVYGLGGNGLDAEASKKIYAAKGRPSDNPLILHIGSFDQLPELVEEVPEKAKALMEAFWPGPLTLIFRKTAIVPKETSGGLDTVAVRMPSDPVAQAFLKAGGRPGAAPSANLSGRPSPTKASHVIEDMDGRIACIIDGGDVPIGVESTIVDCTGETPVLLRPGYITAAQMEAVVGPIGTDPAITREAILSKKTVLRPKAPGMKYRHYAPKAPVTVVSGEAEAVADYIRAHTGPATGILTTDEHIGAFREGVVLSAGKRSDPATIAHNLFSVLRAFDALSVKEIYSEDFTDVDIGTVIMNRLLKAAGGNIINV